jgi:YidC/Oxa1 family membrane protein insertase
VSILNPLYEAIAWILMRIHSVLGGIFGDSSGAAWALSIVFLVIFLRLVLLPLFIKQFHSQRKMMAVAPQLQELRKRYKNDKQRLNEETMKFYKENGVNPLGGCLPMIAQFPVFISLFEVLKAIADDQAKYGLTKEVVNSAQHASVFGALLTDKVLFTGTLHESLSQKAVILVAVLISMTTTFITMRQTTKRGLMNTSPDPDNPMAQSQKYMMYIAPFFALTGLYWQFGLVIYWVTNNLWTMSQQFFMYRNIPITGATGAASATAPATGPKTTVVKSGTARTGTKPRTAGAKTGTSSRTGTSAKTGTTTKTGTASKTGTAAKSGTATKTSTAARTATTETNGTPAKSEAAPKNGSTPKTPASNGTKTGNAKTDAMANGKSGGARGLLRVGRKSEPEPEPEPEPESKIVRQQPVRQSRSKRSGRR